MVRCLAHVYIEIQLKAAERIVNSSNRALDWLKANLLCLVHAHTAHTHSNAPCVNKVQANPISGVLY